MSDEIAALPAGAESDAKAVNSDLDKGMEENLDAALIRNKMYDHVKFAVKNQVVTLTGEVLSESKRRDAGKVAASAPNVQQVVNEMQIRNRKATTTSE